VGGGWDERPIGSGLDGRRLFRFILLLVCSFSRLSAPSVVKIINRDKHKSLVCVPFQNPLLGMVPLIVPNSEYRMKIQVRTHFIYFTTLYPFCLLLAVQVLL